MKIFWFNIVLIPTKRVIHLYVANTLGLLQEFLKKNYLIRRGGKVFGAGYFFQCLGEISALSICVALTYSPPFLAKYKS